jgi:integrase
MTEPSFRDYPRLFAWAEELGLGGTLSNLLLASGARAAAPTNMCVQFVAKPTVREVFTQWAHSDAAAAELLALSDALHQSPAVLNQFLADPTAQPIEELYAGQLADWPLLLFQGVRRPGGDPEDEFWFDQLRVWLLVQAFTRAKAHTTCGKLVTIAMRLRIAGSDRTSESMQWIAALRAAPTSVLAMSRHLRARATHLLPGTPSQDRGKRAFLSALKAVAEGETDPLPDTQDAFTHDLLSLRDRCTEGQDSRADRVQHAHSDFEVDHRSPLPGIEVDVTDETRYTFRLLRARGALIQSAEALQYLPWSWDTPTPLEQDELFAQVARWENSSVSSEKLLAFFCRLAILTSGTLSATQSLRVSADTGDDWAITPDLRTLHRFPWRRSPGWRSKPRDRKWLRKLAERVELDLGPHEHSAIGFGISTLDDAWRAVSPNETAEGMFNRLCRATVPLRRLRSARLQGLFAREIYKVHRDGVLTQLLSSRPATGLGGSSAYPSWTLKFLRETLSATLLPCEAAGADPDANVTGSELDPLDRRLRRSIRSAMQRIDRLSRAPGEWLDHHNALVAYVVAALLAATGGRIVLDPFESPGHFDWISQRIFLCDKATAAGSGRLVPLPAAVLQLVADTYCRHLRALADLLRDGSPAFASEIGLLAARAPSSRLPFFFFLQSKPTLRWYSVGEATLAQQRLFKGPLPWNVGRHRLATRLREVGVDPELIDSLLGHSDHRVLTHGDASPRTWKADMSEVIPALAQAYSVLEFANALPLSVSSGPTGAATDDEGLQKRPFGIAARTQSRRETMLEEAAEALKLYEQVVAGRPADKVTPEEWEDLAISLVRKNGRAHPHARVRYRVLEHKHQSIAREYQLRLRRIFAFHREPESPFRACAIGAEQSLERLQRWFENRPAHPQDSRLGVSQPLALAALDLLLVSRVTHSRLLNELLQRKKSADGELVTNFRVVVHQLHTFLEYHPLLSERADAPVVRYRISNRCAQWLRDAAGANYERDPGKIAVPKRWLEDLPLAQDGKAVRNVRTLVQTIASIVEQANFIERPGLIAAYAAGRLATSALPHRSWRLHTEDLVPTEAQSGAKVPPGMGPITMPPSIATWRAPVSTDAVACQKMFRNMSDALARFPVKEKERRGDRGKLVTRLAAQMQAEAANVSSAVWALGAWVVAMVKRGPKSDPHYAASSILRYLAALSHRFVNVGSDFGLLEADSESLLDFYDQVLEENRDVDLSYVAARLQEFHRFVRTQYSVEDVDWGELDFGSSIPHGSPGIVGEKQYLNALQLLVRSIDTATHEDIAQAFLLILSYRFGLRGADAIGLQSRDWFADVRSEIHPGLVICVRSNALRTLKSPSSRRIVPQLEDFSTFEHAIVSAFLEIFATQREQGGGFPLFASDGAGALFKLSSLTQRINSVLQLVHHDQISMHKGRHAFAWRVAEALMGEFLRPCGNTAGSAHAARVRHLLLGTSRPTRRAPWALGRALGHARPGVSFCSYVHCLPVWFDEWNAARLNAIDAGRCPLKLKQRKNFLGRRGWRTWVALAAADEGAPVHVAPLEGLASFLDVVRGGTATSGAARAAKIPPALGDRALAAIERATLTLKTKFELEGRSVSSLLLHLSESEWAQLRECCRAAAKRSAPSMHQLPPSVQAGLELLTFSRKLLMWDHQHMVWIAAFLRTFGLSENSVMLMSPPNLSERFKGWIDECGLRAHALAGEGRGGHVDSVVGPLRGVLDRCALAVRRYSGRAPATGSGLALLWTVYLSAYCPSVLE